MARKRAEGGADGPLVIRKYANRRLYDTGGSRYVTLGDLEGMVKDGVDFVVVDAKSGDDITRSVLAQIILERDARGDGLLPVGFLRSLISLYDGGMRSLVPGYLEASLEEFMRRQDELSRSMGAPFEGVFPFPGLKEMAERNMDLVRGMMRPDGDRPGSLRPSPPGEGGGERESGGEDEVSALRRELERMRERLDALDKGG